MVQNVLILAAGYGTRLENDITNYINPITKQNDYKHLIGIPKPLIPLLTRPLITYWLELLRNATIHKENIYIVTNDRYYNAFLEFAQKESFPVENIINDGSTSNDTRLGAVGDIKFFLDTKKQWNNDLIVVGGDTIFYQDFSVRKLIETFNKDDDTTSIPTVPRSDPSNVCLYYPIVNDIDTLKTGVLVIDESNSRVLTMLEKPAPTETTSRKGCPCFYMYKRTTLPLINTFIAQATSLSAMDAPGHFLAWLSRRSEEEREQSGVNAYLRAEYVSGRYDIGGLNTLIECEIDMKAKNIQPPK
jgi:NDP-sugar pyrophosphorylase family protein